MKYIAALIGSSCAASKYHLGIFNASTSPGILIVDRVYAASHLTAAIVGTAVTLVLGRTTAAGTGTVQTVRATDANLPALPSDVSILAAYSGNPTLASAPELASLSINNEETAAQIGREELWDDGPLIVRPGTGLVIQQTALAGAGAISLFYHFRIEKRSI